MTGQTWAVGRLSPIDFLDLPGLSWGVNVGARLVLVAPSDDPALATAGREGDLSLGLAQAGPVPVIIARLHDTAGRVLGYYEAPGMWRVGDEPPEVTYTGPERIVWSLHVVEGSPGYERPSLGEPRPLPVVGLRSFTTSPAFTRALRRAHAEQRAAGPMTDEQGMRHMRDYYARNNAGTGAWRRCIITSKAGN